MSNYAADILKTISEELLGAIPVVGTPISMTTKLFAGWVTDSKRKQAWSNLHKSMLVQVQEKVDAAKADAMEKELRGFDENLNKILVDYERGHRDVDAKLQVQARLVALVDRIRAFQPKLYEDYLYIYATAPFLEHFFLDYVTALVAADVLGVKCYDFAELRRTLYLDTREYLLAAMSGVAAERRLHFNAIASSSYRTNRDLRTSTDVSTLYGKSREGTLLPCSQHAGALVATPQLMRLAVLNLSKIIEADIKAGGLNPSGDLQIDMLSAVYSDEMRKLHAELELVWEYDKSWVDRRDIMHPVYWNDVWGKLHSDHEKIADTAWRDKYANCSEQVYGTIFDIPDGRDATPMAPPPPPPPVIFDLPTKIAFKANNGLYLGATWDAGKNYIRPYKSVREDTCIFYAFRRGYNQYSFQHISTSKWLKHVDFGDGRLTLAAYADNHEDPWGLFEIEIIEGGHLTIRAVQNSKYWQRFYYDWNNELILAYGSEVGSENRFSYEAV